MGRPRAFDEEAVLDASARQFRVHGFAHTSTEQLCEAAGVRRSSLYNTFTSKDELFVRSLERLVSVTLEQQEAALSDAALSGSERLASLLALVVEEEREARADGHAAGCMFVASQMAPDIGVREPRAQQLLDGFFDRQLALIAGAVSAGQLDGTLRTDMSPREAALVIVSATSGIRVLSQSGTTDAELLRVADLQLDSLKK